MKKIYLLALLLISSFSFAQSELNFDESDILYGQGSPDDTFIIIEGKLTNSSTSAMTVTWVREEFAMAPGWSSQICDINLCYFDQTSTQSFEIAAGQTLFVKPQFLPKGNTGCSQLRIRIYEEGNAEVNFDEMIFYARAGDVECEDFVEPEVPAGIDDELVQTLNLFPNPVMNELNVSMTNIDNAEAIEIYNLTGKRLDRIYLDGEENIRISAYDWSEGMYILSVLDESDRVIKTQRFSKVR